MDTSTEQLVRLIVADARSRNEIVNVYDVAREIPMANGGHDRNALLDLIAREAVAQHAAVCWDEGDFSPSETSP